MVHVLVRPRRGKVIAGVCDAVAERFGRRAISLRVFMLASSVFFFWLTIPIYITLWAVIPLDDDAP